MAELELKATHAYALIMSLGSSPMRPSNCKLKRELKAGLNSARSGSPYCCSFEKITQIRIQAGARGGNSYAAPAPPGARLVLQQGRTGAAAHRGWTGGIAVAELELEATHAYALIMIMSLGSSLPMRPSNCKPKREAGLNSARLGPPCCCSCHCSSNCDAAAGIIFFTAWARKTYQ